MNVGTAGLEPRHHSLKFHESEAPWPRLCGLSILGELMMTRFGKVGFLAFVLSVGVTGAAFAQSSSSGAMSNGTTSGGAMSNGSMSSGAMASSDKDKMTKKKTDAM